MHGDEIKILKHLLATFVQNTFFCHFREGRGKAAY